MRPHYSVSLENEGEEGQLLAEIYGWLTEGFDTRDLSERVLDFLTLRPRQIPARRLLAMLRQQDSSSLRINQEELAGLVGISRQSISKILRRWRGQGIIEIGYGRITVLDLARLVALSLPAPVGYTAAHERTGGGLVPAGKGGS